MEFILAVSLLSCGQVKRKKESVVKMNRYAVCGMRVSDANCVVMFTNPDLHTNCIVRRFPNADSVKYSLLL